jgi:hypothetical protein
LGNVIPLDEIEVINAWGEMQSNTDKIPTVISYPTEKGPPEWGHRLSPGAIAMIHTKLQLDVRDMDHELEMVIQYLIGMNNLNTETNIRREGGPMYTNKSAEAVITDYLKQVFQYVLRSVRRFSELFLEQTDVDIVITIPSVSRN